MDGEDDVGCLILTDYPEQDTWELIYMGLLPAARRKGYGAAIACHAQWLAGRAGRLRLVTAADAANEPALKVYAAAGFQAWDRRSVFIRILEGSR
jgi:RimJ/RimL family protein N-acetyltransferase